MLLFLSITGILLSVILLYFNARKYTSSIFLGIFFFLVSIYSLYNYMLSFSKSVFFVSIFLFLIPIFGALIYLIGPMLYWYVRGMLTDNSRLKKSDFWHFLPMIIFFITTLPNIFTPWSTKVEAASDMVNNLSAMQYYKPTILCEIFSFPVMFLSRPLLVLCYLIWSITLFISYLSRREESSVLSRQFFMTKWLSVFLGSLLIMLISHILLLIDLTVEGSYIIFTIKTFQILSAAGLTGILISPFFFPEILYGLPKFPEPDKIMKTKIAETFSSPRTSKSVAMHFESTYLLSISIKIDSYMKEFQPYLQQDCNQASFSKLIKIPTHHLAYYFREEKKQSFTSYRNIWRVKHAKKLIAEGKTTNLTLEGIGLLSGFYSRNTFFNTFKKVEGISPGLYVAQITTPPQVDGVSV